MSEFKYLIAQHLLEYLLAQRQQPQNSIDETDMKRSTNKKFKIKKKKHLKPRKHIKEDEKTLKEIYHKL